MARTKNETNPETTTGPSALQQCADLAQHLAPFLPPTSATMRALRVAIEIESEPVAAAVLAECASLDDARAAEASRAIRDQLLAEGAKRAPRACTVATLHGDGSVTLAASHSVEFVDGDSIAILVPHGGCAVAKVLPRLLSSLTSGDLPARITCAVHGLDYAAQAAKAEALRAERRAGFEALAARSRAADSAAARGWAQGTGFQSAEDRRRVT